MILRRLGNKNKIAAKIIPHFPQHKVYYEPFFGTGSMYFNKPKAKYSILNDLDNDVFNLFLVVKENMHPLINLLEITPMSEDLFYYWTINKEIDPVKKALRFMYLSAYSYLGKADTFRLLHSDCTYKQKTLSLIKICSSEMKNTMLRCKDFRAFFNGIYISDKHIGKQDRFIYSDSPYLETEDNYNTPKWSKDDCVDLFDTLEATEIKYALSEFKHPFVVSQAKKRNLNIIEIGERRNLSNRKIEILITNYEPIKIIKPLTLFY